VSRRRRPRTDATTSDLGPAVRLARGDVAVAEAPDPDQPNRTIRRARVVWVPDVLLANGTIGQAQHDAASRLHDAYALGILGARDRLTVYVDRTGAPSGLADARLAAASDYREATQAVGQIAMAPLSWCVLSYGTVAGWATQRGWNPHRAMGYLLAAMDRLAEHYEGGS
jgi:hypothetical protein